MRSLRLAICGALLLLALAACGILSESEDREDTGLILNPPPHSEGAGIAI